jgi:hypothetical protein
VNHTVEKGDDVVELISVVYGLTTKDTSNRESDKDSDTPVLHQIADLPVKDLVSVSKKCQLH